MEKLSANIEQLVDSGFVKAHNDILADFNDRHAHLAAHTLHVTGCDGIFGYIDFLELDLMGPKILHGPFTPTACGCGEDEDFGLLLLFDVARLFF